MSYDFVKMHGLGNDFIIIDQRDNELKLDSEKVKILSNRHTGIGCDQLILIEDSDQETDVFMRIFNQDGEEAGACGNAARCLGALLTEEFCKPSCTISTIEGVINTCYNEDKTVTVDMGIPRCEWQDVPLAKECDTLKLPIKLGVLKNPVAVSMGNPHMVFFVKDINGIDVYNLGKQLTNHPLYPEKANVEFVEVINASKIRIKVYERGVGPTKACASGASASVVAGKRLGLLKNTVKAILDGGELDISYKNDNIIITGNIGHCFKGTFDEHIFNPVKV